MKYKIILIALCAAFALAVAKPVLAGPFDQAINNLNNSVGTNRTGLQGGGPQGLNDMVALVITTILGLVGTIFFILVIYAGVIWMTAQGDEERITKAKSIITAAVIGMVVTLSAYAITYFVGSKLSQSNTPISSST